MSETTAKFSIREALKYGWTTFKAKPLFFAGLTLGLMVFSAVPQVVAQSILGKGTVAMNIVGILLALVNLYLGMLVIRIALDFYDHGDAHIAETASALLSKYFPYLLTKLAYVAMMLIGVMLLIVPGVIVSLMFFFAGYLVLDRGLGPIEALKESKTITDGSKWLLLLMTIVLGLLNIAGFFALFIGLLVTVPVSYLAWVYVYRQLSPKQEAAAV